MITIPETGVYESSISFIWQAENGIVYLVYKPNAVNTLPEAKEHLQILSKIAGDKKCRGLLRWETFSQLIEKPANLRRGRNMQQ